MGDDLEVKIVNAVASFLILVTIVLFFFDIQWMVAFVIMIMVSADFGMIIGLVNWWLAYVAEKQKVAYHAKNNLPKYKISMKLLVRDAVNYGIILGVSMFIFLLVCFFARDITEVYILGADVQCLLKSTFLS